MPTTPGTATVALPADLLAASGQATVSINRETLAALQRAAAFLLAYADDIDNDTQFAADHLRIKCPHATAEAVMHSQQNAHRLQCELVAVIADLDRAPAVTAATSKAEEAAGA
ncbi:hypothetical protein [Streptomyces sp. NPDC093707]|uniref:hypothetical protein n=1 Tax=Streptomyces sp. NPDC093707 TaxID=3154984 RepID=UPI00344C17D9